jgi:hypothetical protein
VGGLIAWAVAVVVIFVLFWVSSTAVVLWRLRRRNRVHPRVASAAPLSWLASPGRAARLHRRLRAAVAAAQFRPGPRRRRRHLMPAGRVHELVTELVQEAVAVDDQLVQAALAPAAVRRHLLAMLETHVVHVECLARRLAALRPDAGRSAASSAAALRSLGERVDALEDARSEIDELEALLRLTAGPPLDERLDPPA